MKISAFYSDPHFNHSNIIKYCSRPFKDTSEMTIELVKRYNSKVSHDDLVVWLGDCAMGSEKSIQKTLSEIIPFMNGKKILVRGNHDGPPHLYLELGFALVVDELNITLDSRPCKLNHFPYAQSDETFQSTPPPSQDRFRAKRPTLQHKKQTLLHGHTHSRTKVDLKNKAINVGVDAWDYHPAMIDEVVELIHKSRIADIT